jgi:succinate-semialdehyde dehydrogenase / glutarate-semialdehyde dehydrogenase
LILDNHLLVRVTKGSMPIATTNPATNIVEKTFSLLNNSQLHNAVNLSDQVKKSWSKTTIKERSHLMTKLGDELKNNREKLAHIITTEIGCPISQAETEIEKCAHIASIFAMHGDDYLRNEKAHTDAQESYISFEPLGTLLHIAPWNYPFYLALRPVIPALMAGNTVLLKHASNTPQTSLALQDMFNKAGFPAGVFQSLLIDSSQVQDIVSNPGIQIVSLIGSEKAGMIVGSQAGTAVKKTIMELGGNDPMIVFEDADLEKVVDGIIASRIRNCGQSCNAAKRYILHKNIEAKIIEKLIVKLDSLLIGDPLNRETDLGPIATKQSLVDVLGQISDTVGGGAELVYGGSKIDREGNFMVPAILRSVKPGMRAFDEEVFGPVITITTFETAEEAVNLANNSQYGLGASIWTADIELAKSLIPQIEAGNVYVNGVVRGDPKMPFGGVKMSGFGREFGEYGIKEFVNIKSVVIK